MRTDGRAALQKSRDRRAHLAAPRFVLIAEEMSAMTVPWTRAKHDVARPALLSTPKGLCNLIPAGISAANIRRKAKSTMNPRCPQSSIHSKPAQLFVKNIPVEMSDKALQSLFRQAGEIFIARKVRPKNPKFTFTFGFVTYATSDEAVAAISLFNGYKIGSRCLAVMFAKSTDHEKDEVPPVELPGSKEIKLPDMKSLNVEAGRIQLVPPVELPGSKETKLPDMKSLNVEAGRKQLVPPVELPGSKRIKLRDMKFLNMEAGRIQLCLISEWRNASCFYVMPMMSLLSEALHHVQHYQFSSNSAPPGHHPIPGEVFLGCYTIDQTWCRATLEDTNAAEAQYNVLYIDFGNVETLGADSIRLLPDELAELPVCALRCRTTATSTLSGQPVDGPLTKTYLNSKVCTLFKQFDKETHTWVVDFNLMKEPTSVQVAQMKGKQREEPQNPPLGTNERWKATQLTNDESTPNTWRPLSMRQGDPNTSPGGGYEKPGPSVQVAQIGDQHPEEPRGSTTEGQKKPPHGPDERSVWKATELTKDTSVPQTWRPMSVRQAEHNTSAGGNYKNPEAPSVEVVQMGDQHTEEPRGSTTEERQKPPHGPDDGSVWKATELTKDKSVPHTLRPLSVRQADHNTSPSILKTSRDLKAQTSEQFTDEDQTGMKDGGLQDVLEVAKAFQEHFTDMFERMKTFSIAINKVVKATEKQPYEREPRVNR